MARGYVSYSVAVTPVRHGEFSGGHGDTVKELSHAAHGREAAVDGELGFTVAEIGFGGNSEFEHTSG